MSKGARHEDTSLVQLWRKCPFKKTKIVELGKDWGITPEEWSALSDDQKWKMAEEWAYDNGLEIGYEEIGE